VARWIVTAIVVSAFGVPPARVEAPPVTFKYPSTWRAEVWRTRTLHFVPVVGVGNVAFSELCTAEANAIACSHFPVKRLPRGGVVAWWAFELGPPTRRRRPVKTNTRIGGVRAFIRTTRPGPCRAIGGDETIALGIGRSLRFTACLRRPRLSANDLRIRTLLATVRFERPTGA
jgi:hypothetical protein